MFNYPGLFEFCQGLYDGNIRSPHLLGFMVDCYGEMLDPDNKCKVDSEEILDKIQKVRCIQPFDL